MIGRYRIYPAWFHGTGGGTASAVVPMNELAEREAKRLDLAVSDIMIVAEDRNERGDYIDFDVLYVPSSLLKSSRE